MKTFSWLLAAVLSASVFVLFFSTTTSPLYDYGAMFDSAMFQVIGRGWAEGVLPYTGLWDSKGPMIFFINAIGYALTGTSFGVCILQIVSLSAAMCVVFKWLSLAYSPRGALLLGLVVLAGLLLGYDFGNLTEEYLLPLLFMAYYLMYKWTLRASEGVYAHPAKYALVYGMVLGFSLMTRVTNAVGVCVGVLFVMMFLVKGRLWRNILSNAVLFTVGFLVVVVPFVIYFHSQGALSEMWYGTFVYNIGYADNSASFFTSASVLYSSLRYVLCLLLVAVGVMVLFSKNFLQGVFWITVSFSTFVYLCVYLSATGNAYHYGMIALPYLCAALVLVKCCLASKPVISKAYMCAAMAVVFAFFVRRLDYLVSFDFNAKSRPCINMLRFIPENERDKCVVYNCFYNIGAYVWAGIRPAVRYFAFQDWAVERNNTLRPALLAEYSRLKAKWILFEGDAYDTEIGGIVRRHYRLVKEDKTNGYSLFRLKEKGLTGNVED